MSDSIEELLSYPFYKDFLYASYITLLNRKPDLQGSSVYLKQLRNGTPYEEVLYHILNSEEFLTTGNRIYGTDEFLTEMKKAKTPKSAREILTLIAENNKNLKIKPKNKFLRKTLGVVKIAAPYITKKKHLSSPKKMASMFYQNQLLSKNEAPQSSLKEGNGLFDTLLAEPLLKSKESYYILNKFKLNGKI